MLPIEFARVRAQRLDAARKKFKTHPLYASVRVELHEKSLKIGENFPPPVARLSKEGFECAAALFHIHAEAYLAMVDDMAFQDAYVVFLESFARKAWEQFSGIPLEQLATPEDFSFFQQAVAHWTAEGYRRISVNTKTDSGTAGQPKPESTKLDGIAIDEKSRRERLLAEYKAATENPSNRRIYSSRNSGIHKPQFYQWTEGGLPATSATTINFERFLRDKKPPIPRKPKS
jgi:hypothetical protein